MITTIPFSTKQDADKHHQSCVVMKHKNKAKRPPKIFPQLRKPDCGVFMQNEDQTREVKAQALYSQKKLILRLR